MLNEKFLYTLVWLPMVLVSISTTIMGCMWMFSSEPWLLDQAANEILLQTTYDKLFAADINSHLSDYLTGLYRFFGLWIFLIGLLMSIYIFASKLDKPKSRVYLYLFLAVLLTGLYYFQYQFIATSHFVWTTHSIFLAFLVSGLTSLKLHTKQAMR